MFSVDRQIFLVNGSLINRVGTGMVDDLTVIKEDKVSNSFQSIMSYHKRIPSLTFSYRAFPSESIGSKCFKSGSLARLLWADKRHINYESLQVSG